MRLTDFLTDMGSPIAYYPRLTRVTGGVTATVLLCQLIYWIGKGQDGDGWIFKTQVELADETGLSRHEQDTARKRLRQAGLIQEERRGVPAQLYYRVNLERLDAAWGDTAIQSAAFRQSESGDKQECGNPAIKTAATRQSSMADRGEQDCHNPPNIKGTETTTEITPEITAESSSSAAAAAAVSKRPEEMSTEQTGHAASFARAFGREPMPAERDCLSVLAAECRAADRPELLGEAITYAAEMGAHTPKQYIATVVRGCLVAGTRPGDRSRAGLAVVANNPEPPPPEPEPYDWEAHNERATQLAREREEIRRREREADPIWAAAMDELRRMEEAEVARTGVRWYA